MNIAIIAGGSSIHTIRWANGLVHAGADVHLITQHPLIDELDDRVNVTEFRYRGNLGYFLIVPAVKRLLRRIKPDVVSAHYASGYGTTARLVGYRPWMLSVWGSDVYDFPEKSPIHRWLVRKNLTAADQVASTSYCMADRTRDLAPSLNRIEITPFGVDIESFTSYCAQSTCTDDNPLTVGTVKLLSHKYGVDTLIRAFALVRDKCNAISEQNAGRLRLRIVGDGPQLTSLRLLAAELGVADVTEFVGRVRYAQIPAELSKLDIYVALSRLDSESFGVAVIEASAACRPVVVSDAGGLPEVVVAEQTGLLVPREDPEAAANAICRLVRDPELRLRLGKAGREHVRAQYDWSVSVQKMISALGAMSVRS